VNQEDNEHNEVDGMKKGADSTGKVMHITLIASVTLTTLPRCTLSVRPSVRPVFSKQESVETSNLVET